MAVFVIWLVILVVIIGNGWNTALWIFFIGSALLVVAAATGNRQKKQPGAAGKVHGEYDGMPEMRGEVQQDGGQGRRIHRGNGTVGRR